MNLEFHIKIKLGNDAMSDLHDVADALTTLARRYKEDDDALLHALDQATDEAEATRMITQAAEATLRDRNGNAVGKARVIPALPEEWEKAELLFVSTQCHDYEPPYTEHTLVHQRDNGKPFTIATFRPFLDPNALQGIVDRLRP